MPAPFTKDLCGYRDNGKPNTSDASQRDSVALGIAMFDALGVPRDKPGADETGLPFAARVAEDLHERLVAAGSVHQALPEQHINKFQQFRHVGAISDVDVEPSMAYARAWKRLTTEVRKRIVSPPANVRRIEEMIDNVEVAVASEVEKRRKALHEVGQESVLKLDVTVSEPQPGWLPELEIGLSLKWSLRTDRLQDPRSQGAKLAGLRRGRMPHYAPVTMEPRPSLLKMLCGGSGDLDCVYHLHLPALTAAIDEVYGSKSDKTSKRIVTDFSRLVEQRRLRDYDELVKFAISL